MPSSITTSYKYPNPSPLAPRDRSNGSINETFVLNCPKCASHFQSSQLLEQHLQIEHSIVDYTSCVVNVQNGNESGTEIMEDDSLENRGDMMVEHEDGNEDIDYEGSQDVVGQDTPYSGAHNVVRKCIYIYIYIYIYNKLVVNK